MYHALTMDYALTMDHALAMHEPRRDQHTHTINTTGEPLPKLWLVLNKPLVVLPVLSTSPITSPGY